MSNIDIFGMKDSAGNTLYFPNGGSGESELANLDDVALSSPANNQVLKYNSETEKWENKSDDAGSGHTIVNDTTTFTQRAKLKFTGNGVTVTDDSTNGQTIVSIPGGGGGGKQPSIISVDASASVSDATPTVTKAVTITQGDGTLSATSSDTSVATVTVSGSNVVITGVDTGSATITVSLSETANYYGVSATIAVSSTVSPPFIPTVGTKYKLGSGAHTGGTAIAEATCLAVDSVNNTALMISNGLYGAAWPGSSELDISIYMGNLSSAVDDAYLVRGESTDSLSVFDSNDFITSASISSFILNLFTNLATSQNYGTVDGGTYLSSDDGTKAYAVNSLGNINKSVGSAGVRVVAPTFILDLTQVTLIGSAICLKGDSGVVIGDTYLLGDYKWTAAEDLGDDTVCLQSQGMTAGYWPGYTLASDYSGAKSYGSADTIYDGNIDGDNIANYDAVTQAWYTKYASVEKTGQAYGSGLFLVSNVKCGTTTSGEVGSGNYFEGIKTAGSKYSDFGAAKQYTYLGTYGSSSGQCWDVNSGNGKVMSSYTQNYTDLVIAPAFNLDLTKVKIVDNTIIPSSEVNVPTGSTVTPTNSVETWLRCAGIFDKPYTTLAEVLADSSTLATLIASQNAVDYLVRCKDWCDRGLVPTMTSNTTPSGECIASTELNASSKAYYAFDKDSSTLWASQNEISQNNTWLGYIFPTAVSVAKIYLYNYSSNGFIDGKIQASADGNTWVDIKTFSSLSTSENTLIIENRSTSYRYWRILNTQDTATFRAVRELQFYSGTENLCDNQTFMSYVGLNNYASNTLLADSTWLNAIANSTYIESVMNVKVPTLSSDTSSDGGHAYNPQLPSWGASSYPAYKVFDNDDITYTLFDYDVTEGKIYYMFPNEVMIKKAKIFKNGDSNANGTITYKYSYSDDGSNWTDVDTSKTLPNNQTNNDIIDYTGSHKYWGIHITNNVNSRIACVNTLQFYGREDV